MPYTPIRCDLYDYIEIACLRHYTLTIKLLDGEKIQGKAETTKIEDKQEFLIVSLKLKLIKIKKKKRKKKKY